jgi:putative transposase
MQRTNTFIIEDNCNTLFKLADNCSKLWNELNYERRKTYINGKSINWYPKHLYNKYSVIIGSATTQQIINKNNEAWRSFLALKKMEREGKLPKHITRVSMPRYWKYKGKRELRIIVRNDCYKVIDGYLYLPNGIRLRYKGNIRWKGKQGRLEIFYDRIDNVWRGFMSVNVSNSNNNNNNNNIDSSPRVRESLIDDSNKTTKRLYIDLGVVNIATVWYEGLKQPVAFSGRRLLADWWYWSRRISEEQSRLAKINNANRSRRLSKLYRIRQRRFKHAINAMVKTIVDNAYHLGIREIILGKLKGIRRNNNNSNNNYNNNTKANAMVNNFWSYSYIIRRVKEKAEEYGINVKEISEYKTSSICPYCNLEGVRRYRGLFYCKSCNMVINADVVGVLNIARKYNNNSNNKKNTTIIPSPSFNTRKDRDNWVMAHPLLLRWNGMRWEPRRAMNNQPMNILEARILTL